MSNKKKKNFKCAQLALHKITKNDLCLVVGVDTNNDPTLYFLGTNFYAGKTFTCDNCNVKLL